VNEKVPVLFRRTFWPRSVLPATNVEFPVQSVSFA
jgi:hypothetical protein